MFEQGIAQESSSSERAALEKAEQQWTTLVNKVGAAHVTLKEETTRLTIDALRQTEEQHNVFTKKLQEAESSFKALEKTFKEKLALLAPVTYWDAKATIHLRVSIGLAIAFAVLGSLSAFLVWLELQAFVIPMTEGHQQSNYWRYAIPVATATMLLWPLRILSRMLLSNLHLREDARERVTMANTYLALVQSKEGLKDEDRKLILEMLFRPASLGIVYDDAAPPSITHFLSRLGSGQR
ncbi:MAG: hypothetical protein HC938_05535 [Nitrospira sp.]|nr:hypothetical protein [Nitrospira sp.]